MAMTSEESPQTVIRPRGVVAGFRAVVRQVAAAVYIAIIYGVVAHKLGQHGWAWLVEPLAVLLGSAVVGFIVEGPWWTYGFVGFFVGFFVGILNAVIVFVIEGHGGGWRSLGPLAVPLAVSTLVGAGGGLLGRALSRLLGKRRQSV